MAGEESQKFYEEFLEMMKKGYDPNKIKGLYVLVLLDCITFMLF